MVPQPSIESVDSRTLSRRRCLQAGIATVSLVGVPAVDAQSGPEPPGVVERRRYENLPVTATVDAHGAGRILVGRAGGSYPTADDPVRVALTDASGAVRQRASFTPELPDDAHAAPDVLRTEDGYAVAAGPWLARLDTDLSLRTTGKHADGIGASRETTLVSTDDGFVAGFTEWLPNAFWTWIVGFDADGQYRWHREVNDNGSQELGFLHPRDDGGVVAGGTYPWLAEFDADGSARRIDIPDDLPETTLNAGIKDGDGIILCSGSEAARLDAAYDLDWTREYDPLGDGLVGGITPVDDGFLFRTTPVGEGDVTLAKAGADGERQWHHTYRVETETALEIHTLTRGAHGEYLLAGGANTSTEGWVLTLSEAATPTPEPTATATGTPPSSAAPTTADRDRETTTTGPGFGAAAGVTALAGVVVGALRRVRD